MRTSCYTSTFGTLSRRQMPRMSRGHAIQRGWKRLNLKTSPCNFKNVQQICGFSSGGSVVHSLKRITQYLYQMKKKKQHLEYSNLNHISLTEGTKEWLQTKKISLLNLLPHLRSIPDFGLEFLVNIQFKTSKIIEISSVRQ